MHTATVPLFQPVPIAHLEEANHEKMQARAPRNPVREVGWFDEIKK